MPQERITHLTPRVGVLSLQGDFACHLRALENIGVRGVEVRSAGDLNNLDGLILPGGESSTISILLDRFEMREALRDKTREIPVWGSCAGMIMLAKEIVASADARGVPVEPLGVLDISVARNGFGRQSNSFEREVEIAIEMEFAGRAKVSIPGCFIRAPKITRIGEGVEVLGRLDNEPVLVRRGNILASSFHTELTDDLYLTKYFVESMISGAAYNSGFARQKQLDQKRQSDNA